MPSDKELYTERNTVLRDVPTDARAAEILAERYGLKADSVRGRLSRAHSIYENRIAVMKRLASETPDDSPSVVRQIAVIERSKHIWKNSNIGQRTLVFFSDLHLGQPRWDAYNLALEICDYVQPDYITAQNDSLDNKGFGRWLEDRPVRGQVWTSDDANLRMLEHEHYRNLTDIAKRGLPALSGNHDNWYFKYQREHAPQTAEATIASYMESLSQQGILLFERGYRENVLELSPGVVVWHGQFVQKNLNGLAKSNLEYMLQLYKDGIVRSVVAGHTHRPFSVEGGAVGYPGSWFVNSGALTDYTPYMKRNPHNHGLGITVIDYDTNSREHDITLIRFIEHENRLEAKYQGKLFSTPIDKSHRDDYR